MSFPMPVPAEFVAFSSADFFSWWKFHYASFLSHWSGSALGVGLQLSSSIAYALKFTVVKRLLGDGSSSDSDSPSKFLIALVTNPVMGLSSLAFLPLFENSWALPPTRLVFTFSLQCVLILIFELRLTELTSPLTVSVLAALHNVVIVGFFVIVDGEHLKVAQLIGFGMSTFGAIIYAWLKFRKARQYANRMPKDYLNTPFMSPSTHLVAPFPKSPKSPSMRAWALMSPLMWTRREFTLPPPYEEAPRNAWWTWWVRREPTLPPPYKQAPPEDYGD